MSRVKLIQVGEASGKAGEVFADIQQGFGMVPNLFKAYAHRPEIMAANWSKVKAVMLTGELPRTLKEMIAVVVSKANGCQYCVAAHSAALRMLGESEEQCNLLVDGFEAADLPEDTKVVLRLAVKSTRQPQAMTDNEFEELRKLGYSESQIIEMLSVVDLFTSFNRFLDTLRIPLDFPTSRE